MIAAVTGACGHLGGNLIRALLEAGHHVRAVDLRADAAIEGLQVTFVEADVLEPESLRRAFRGVEVVFHLAAIISVTGDPHGQVQAVNVTGVQNMADAALACGVRRVVHCSSVPMTTHRHAWARSCSRCSSGACPRSSEGDPIGATSPMCAPRASARTGWDAEARIT